MKNLFVLSIFLSAVALISATTHIDKSDEVKTLSLGTVMQLGQDNKQVAKELSVDHVNNRESRKRKGVFKGVRKFGNKAFKLLRKGLRKAHRTYRKSGLHSMFRNMQIGRNNSPYYIVQLR